MAHITLRKDIDIVKEIRVNFRELKQEDIDAVKNDSISRGILSKQPESIDFGYTLEHEGKVLGIGGFRLINMTTIWCWTDWTHFAREHTITAYRTVREYIDIFAKEHKIKRAQAYVECSFPEAIRMVEHLGFHRESVMPNFVENESAYLYVKFFGE